MIHWEIFYTESAEDAAMKVARFLEADLDSNHGGPGRASMIAVTQSFVSISLESSPKMKVLTGGLIGQRFVTTLYYAVGT